MARPMPVVDPGDASRWPEWRLPPTGDVHRQVGPDRGGTRGSRRSASEMTFGPVLC